MAKAVKKVFKRDKLGKFTSSVSKSVPAKKKTASKVKSGNQHDFILLDRSGSMQTLWSEALGAINGYAKDLVTNKVDTKVTMAVFDSTSFDVIRKDIVPSKWDNVSNRDAMPGSMTPLNDAVGKLVNMAKEGNYSRVAIIIMTDGQENASRELTKPQAKALLDECRAKGWQVIMLGADFDNATQAVDYGNAAASTAEVGKGKLGKAMSFTASSRSAYGVSGQSMTYSAEQKRSLI